MFIPEGSIVYFFRLISAQSTRQFAQPHGNLRRSCDRRQPKQFASQLRNFHGNGNCLYPKAQLFIPEGSIVYTRRLNTFAQNFRCNPSTHPLYPLYLPSRCLPTLIREHATPATTTMPRVASSDRLRRSICSNGLGVPKAKSAATHTPSLPATSSSGATREGLSAGRLNARASTRMGRGTSDLTLPAALLLLRRHAESQLSVQLQAVMHLYIYTPRAEQRAPQAA